MTWISFNPPSAATNWRPRLGAGLFVLLFHGAGAGLAQNGDCTTATEINLDLKQRVYETNQAPAGPGQVMEIQAPRFDVYAFEKEHHTAWYRFSAPANCLMGLTISPCDTLKDYDFIIYPDSSPNTCELIRQRQLQPLRSVISRNDRNDNSRTGLRYGATQAHIHEGPGDSWAPLLPVKRDHYYLLVLDNVYGGGCGHHIEFHYYYRPRLFGTITDKFSGKPLRADIVLYDEQMAAIDTFSSHAQSGRYRAQRPLEYGHNYRLICQAKGYFSQSFSADYQSLRQLDDKPLNAALTPIREGAVIELEKMHFVGDKDEFLPEAYPALEALLQTMQTYAELEIHIEGHVNGAHLLRGAPDKYPGFAQWLSEARAIAVKNYLIRHGIAAERMSTEGFGYSRMIFPNTYDEDQMSRNRRVEVRVGKR